MVSLSWFIEIRKYGGKGKIDRVTFNESFAAVGTGTSLRWDRVICCETWTNESKFVLIGNFALIFKNERDIYTCKG